MIPQLVTGIRHARDDRPCQCGCQHVVGLAGAIVLDDDTPRLARLDPPMAIASFAVPCPAGGATREEQVAYSYAELALQPLTRSHTRVL